MVQLTNETRLNKSGETIDDSKYLVHVDRYNLGIVRGQRTSSRVGHNVIGFYGDVSTALKAAIKDRADGVALLETLQTIDDLTEHIETSYKHHIHMSRIWQSELNNKDAVKGSMFIPLSSNGMGLVRYDKRNLALVKQESDKYQDTGVLGYYGTMQRALTAAINIRIKSLPLMTDISEVDERIADLSEWIDAIDIDVDAFMRGTV